MNDPIIHEMHSAGNGKVDRPPTEIIPLGEAQLCEDCKNITRGRFDHCPACGSGSVVRLAQILERTD